MNHASPATRGRPHEVGRLPVEGLPAAGLAPSPDELLVLYADGAEPDPGVYFVNQGTALYRDDSITSLVPRPDLAAIFPLESAPMPYLPPAIAPGVVDPDAAVLSDAGRPLVLYGLSRPAELKLVKTPEGLVRLDW